MNSNDYELKIFFGHHKCASEWIIQILLRVTGYLGLKTHYLENKFDEEYYRRIDQEIRRNKVSMLLCQTSSMKKADYLNNFKGFHVVRDPRDICVSGYYSHLYSHRVDSWPELFELRNKLQKISRNEGLFLEMEFLKEFYTDMFNWDYQQENVLEIKLEDLTRNPHHYFCEIFQFLGLLSVDNPNHVKELILDLKWFINMLNRRYPIMVPFNFQREAIHQKKLFQFIDQFNFKKLARGRRKGEVDVTSHYRKGQPDDWMDHFNSKHKKFFKDNYGELLVKLGYETSMDW